MANLILTIVFLALALAGVVVRKTYYYVPVVELKRRAGNDDHVASQLYPTVAYGTSLRTLLWLYIGITSALSFVFLARHLSLILSLIIIATALWVAFSWLPASRLTKSGRRLTLLVNPAILWLLVHLHPPLEVAGDIITKRTSVVEHTGVFEREDLLGLLAKQRQQTDNRLDDKDLVTAERALQFNEATVSDILTPADQVKVIFADDSVGPILFDELHKSGQQTVVVKDKADDEIVGTLHVGQVALKSTGHVRTVMNKQVCYVHQADSLGEALRAFFVTGQPTLIVTNDSAEFIGIVSVEQIIKQLVDTTPDNDFDDYGDIAAVADHHASYDVAFAPAPPSQDNPEPIIEDVEPAPVESAGTAEEASKEVKNEPAEPEPAPAEIAEQIEEPEPPETEAHLAKENPKSPKASPQPADYDDDIETIEFDNTKDNS